MAVVDFQKFGQIALKMVDEALEMPSSARGAVRSLGLCVVLGFFLFLVLIFFHFVGLWPIVIALWLLIAGVLWRAHSQHKLDFSKVMVALKAPLKPVDDGDSDPNRKS